MIVSISEDMLGCICRHLGKKLQGLNISTQQCSSVGQGVWLISIRSPARPPVCNYIQSQLHYAISPVVINYITEEMGIYQVKLPNATVLQTKYDLLRVSMAMQTCGCTEEKRTMTMK
eukprot:4990905-Amphidinium_carterae.1